MSDLLFETSSTQATLTQALHDSIALLGGSRIKTLVDMLRFTALAS